MAHSRHNSDTFEDQQTDKSQDIDAWTFAKCAMTGCANQARMEHVVMTQVVRNKYVTFYVCSPCWVKYIQPWLMRGKVSNKG